MNLSSDKKNTKIKAQNMGFAADWQRKWGKLFSIGQWNWGKLLKIVQEVMYT